MATDTVKPKLGRPATGKDPVVGLRLPPEKVAEIDAWADKRGIRRSEAIRTMIDDTLVRADIPEPSEPKPMTAAPPTSGAKPPRAVVEAIQSAGLDPQIPQASKPRGWDRDGNPIY